MDRKKRFTFQRAVGGNNHHCCVPLCTAGGRFNKVLSFHSFPKEPTLRAQWLVKVRREGFTPTTSSRVCSRHFEQEDIVISSAGKRCLRPNIIPSLFGWNNYTKKPQRPGVWDRRPRAPQALDRAPEDDTTPEDDSTVEMELGENSVSGCTELASTPLMEDHDYTASSFIVVDREKFESMSRQIEELTRQIETLHMERFGLQRFSTSPSDIRYYSR